MATYNRRTKKVSLYHDEWLRLSFFIQENIKGKLDILFDYKEVFEQQIDLDSAKVKFLFGESALIEFPIIFISPDDEAVETRLQ